jgi:hypothetical protein
VNKRVFRECEGMNNRVENWSLENEACYEKHKNWRDNILGKSLMNFDTKISVRRMGEWRNEERCNRIETLYIGSTKNNAATSST